MEQNGKQRSRPLLEMTMTVESALARALLKGPFIATQLNSTQRRVELCRHKRALRQKPILPYSVTLRMAANNAIWRMSLKAAGRGCRALHCLLSLFF